MKITVNIIILTAIFILRLFDISHIMRNKDKNIQSKSICIGKIVAIFNTVVSMEFKALGNILCFQISLNQNQFSIKLVFR